MSNDSTPQERAALSEAAEEEALKRVRQLCGRYDEHGWDEPFARKILAALGGKP